MSSPSQQLSQAPGSEAQEASGRGWGTERQKEVIAQEKPLWKANDKRENGRWGDPRL
jgi:hypothetical protein